MKFQNILLVRLVITRYHQMITIIYFRQNRDVCKCACVCVCEYVCMYICIYVYFTVKTCAKISSADTSKVMIYIYF